VSAFNLVDWILTIAAIIVSWQLHSAVLRQPPTATPAQSALPGGGSAPPVSRQPVTLEERLERVHAAGGYRELADFLRGATLAYEEIVMAFARGDLQDVLPLLGPAVREAFARAIADRQERGESLSTTVIGVAAEPVDAGIDGGTAWLEVRFATELVSASTDREGRLIGGDPRHVAEVAEVWTFSRDVASLDPNWTLVATDEDG